MRVYVPSRGRAGFIGAKNTTARWLRGATWVVPPDEQARYQRALSNVDQSASVEACSQEGIARTRRWIGLHAQGSGESKFLMADDDLTFSVRVADGSRLRPANREDINEMLAWTASALDECAHASVLPRNVAHDKYEHAGKSSKKYNKRTLRYLAYRVEDFLAMEHGRVPVMEDFDVNLQLLCSGRTNVQSYWWAQDQPETGTVGGCSSYRTLEAHNVAALRLVELHAPFVELRKKVNKSALSGAAERLRERLEVTVFWEKAARSGGWVKP